MIVIGDDYPIVCANADFLVAPKENGLSHYIWIIANEPCIAEGELQTHTIKHLPRNWELAP